MKRYLNRNHELIQISLGRLRLPVYEYALFLEA